MSYYLTHIPVIRQFQDPVIRAPLFLKTCAYSHAYAMFLRHCRTCIRVCCVCTCLNKVKLIKVAHEQSLKNTSYEIAN
jgi:hypothetical protein